MKLRTVAAATSAALMLSFGGHAMADSTEDIINALVGKGVLTEEEGKLLLKGRAGEKEAAPKMPKITTKGKIKVEGADGNWSFQPIGRVMVDYIDTDEDGSGASNVDGFEFRRGRLGFQGKVYNWGYKLEADFAKSSVSLKDAYVSYGTKLAGNKFGVKVGQSHVPYGLNTKISSKYMSFIDRPWFADDSISPARQPGFVASIADPKYKWTLAAGYQYAGSSSYKGFSGGSAEKEIGKTIAVRGSVVPLMKDKKHMLQIGAGYLNLSDDPASFKFEQRLVSHLDNDKHLKTSVADFDGADAFTLDALGIYGPFHAMAEYNSYDMDSKAGNDVDIDSYAIEAGYFITGESLKWKKGYTSGITPMSASGAWQIVGRFENTEIDDTLAGDDEAEKFSVGLNFYPRQNLRLMLNYDKVTDLKVNGANVDFEPESVKFRAQAYW